MVAAVDDISTHKVLLSFQILHNSNLSNLFFSWPLNSVQTVGELGLRSKYLSSEYKKPVCIELEDVKISQTFDNDLDTREEKHLEATRCEEMSAMRNDDAKRYIQRAKDNFIKLLNYLLQFVPPTTMIILQVIFLLVIVFDMFSLSKVCTLLVHWNSIKEFLNVIVK